MDIDTTTGSETESATVESATISASASVTSLDQEVSMVLGTSPRPYSTSWLFTGPLIEKYRISTGKYNPWFLGGKYYAVQRAEFASEEEALANMGPETHEATGNSTLEAICSLLLQLHKAGKL